MTLVAFRDAGVPRFVEDEQDGINVYADSTEWLLAIDRIVARLKDDLDLFVLSKSTDIHLEM